ncbi:glutamate-1-semialdehyde 2,1-aminomutase [Pediococcus claussenii]|uniref:Glutamate-1-semialdehyde 2,1-aminomutase n=1 Tax=Pediococcus claussenii (strain ATCC BAA-344 / DSM 14800 / JCM 18046 / KCTC 3811 / LMG 21948 / P06) TaxID=701521 RepID=G8PEM8_PEDCP|nr:glutamate-1-semialdehyde 2,1-aminomutase [Pediococcus claussenii]AEV95637.1 glutamate-1-semialdehyde-2,1-aminomutase [Pediococcus claussenii ATCC BAA-344]ANZ69157.1 glutamate-1-semialdehyde aminotransferase [Pediococcus claussenii]ANZ70974.1 glutamate-1-semialdehyde aminotransferase [Pediococcus claussenii]KRN20130.1 hemL protein [Pediococcus claussenii]
MKNFEKSIAAYKEAVRYMPGGVNSPVRAFSNVEMDPIFIERGKNQYLYDIDGNSYVDYVLSWGPLILGHADDTVISALKETIDRGTSFGAPTLVETKLAQTIQSIVPSMEMMRMVSSGTEATMSAVRLARGYTGRDKIVKFIGNYHGHSDSLIVDAGSGLATLDINTSPGVPKSITYETLTVPYNDVEAIQRLFENFGDEIAGVIVEPIAGNMGLIPGKKEFLQKLRELTTQHGSVLIFDEVMSGFRCDLHGAQGLYGITPDLTTLGKVVGGGLPVGVFGGKREIMKNITPEGSVYHAGTLSGNPLAMTAGITTLTQLKEEDYSNISRKLDYLSEKVQASANRNGIPFTIRHVGSMWGYFFTDGTVENFDDVQATNKDNFYKFFNYAIRNGLYIASSPFETSFLSTKHTDDDIEKTIQVFSDAFKTM